MMVAVVVVVVVAVVVVAIESAVNEEDEFATDVPPPEARTNEPEITFKTCI